MGADELLRVSQPTNRCVIAFLHIFARKVFGRLEKVDPFDSLMYIFQSSTCLCHESENQPVQFRKSSYHQQLLAVSGKRCLDLPIYDAIDPGMFTLKQRGIPSVVSLRTILGQIPSITAPQHVLHAGLRWEIWPGSDQNGLVRDFFSYFRP